MRYERKTVTHMMFVAAATMIVGLAAPGAEPTNAPSSRPSSRPTSRPTTTRPVATRPSIAPTSRPAAKVKEQDPLRVAILELEREAQAALQQKKPLPREKSDYFTAGNPIKTDALLTALGSQIHENPRIDAYVKFQLLSAVETFEGDDVLPALKAYVLSSPAMIALPGSTQQEQQVWTQKAMNAKRDDLEKINQEWNETLVPYLEANAIIIAYRDLMKSRIHPSDQIRHKYFQAVLEDLAQRGAAGIEIDKDLTALSKTILAWSHLAKKAQLKEMQAALEEYTARKPPRFYEKLTWRRTDNKAEWTYHYAGLPVSKVAKIQEEIEKALPDALE